MYIYSYRKKHVIVMNKKSKMIIFDIGYSDCGGRCNPSVFNPINCRNQRV